MRDYSKLRADTQGKNIVAWTPVVAEILDGFCRFDDKAVSLCRIVSSPSLPDLLVLVLALFASHLPTGDRLAE